jgi:hypothetical protein
MWGLLWGRKTVKQAKFQAKKVKCDWKGQKGMSRGMQSARG